MQKHPTLYGLRQFKDLQKMLFLRNCITEGNIHDLFTAHITRDSTVKQTGKIYLCHLTDREFITKNESGDKYYHLFLLHETDPHILLLENKQEYHKKKPDIISPINPFDLPTVLEFKVIGVKRGEELYANTLTNMNHNLH